MYRSVVPPCVRGISDEHTEQVHQKLSEAFIDQISQTVDLINHKRNECRYNTDKAVVSTVKHER